MPRSKAQFNVSFLDVEYHVNQLAAPHAESLVDSQVSLSDSMVRVQVAGQEGFRGGIFSYTVSAFAATQNHKISSKQLFFVLQCAPPIPWRGQPIVESRAQSIRSSDAMMPLFPPLPSLHAFSRGLVIQKYDYAKASSSLSASNHHRLFALPA